jgi:autotransporter-associated beta strand protein
VLTLSGSARTLYWGGGITDIADGTPLPTDLADLAGTWNLTTKNWATDESGTTYTNWTSGDDMTASFADGLTSASGRDHLILLDADITLNEIYADFPVNAYWYGLRFSSTAVRTITFAGENPTCKIAANNFSLMLQIQDDIQLVGTDGLILEGGGRLQIENGCSGLTGTADMVFSRLYLTEASTDMSGVSKFKIRNSSELSVYARSYGDINVLNDGAVIEMTEGSIPYFEYRGYSHSSTPSVENIDSIKLNPHGMISPCDRYTGSGLNGQLVMTNTTAGIDRGVDGKGTMFVKCDSSGTLLTDFVVQNGYAINTRFPWAVSYIGSGVELDADKAVSLLSPDYAPIDLSTWVADQSYVVTGEVAFVNEIDTITIKSLGITREQTETMTIGDGKTLTLSDGQLARLDTGGDYTFTIDGGKITSGNGELYLFAAQDPNANLTIKSELTGDIDVITCGASALTFSGTNENTYTGTTYINAGEVILGRGNDNTCISGDLVIGSSGHLNCNNDNQINTNSDVTIRDSGILDVGDLNTQLFNGIVTIEGGLLQYSFADPIIFSHTGTSGLIFNGGEIRARRGDNGPIFKILTDVRCDASMAEQAVISSARQEAGYEHYLTLATSAAEGSWTWDVENSTELSSDIAELSVEMPLGEYWNNGAPISVQKASLTKSGSGVVHLKKSTDYLSGDITIDEGTIISDGGFTRCLIQSGLAVLNSSVVADLTTTVGLYIGQKVNGPFSSYTAYIESIDSPTQVTMTNPVLFNAGTQTFRFFGGSALGYGSVAVNDGGTLGGSGAGPVTVASGGTLAPGGLGSACVAAMTNEAVVINDGGTFAIDINSQSNDSVTVYGDLTLSGHVSVSLVDGFDPEADAEWVIGTCIDGTIDVSDVSVDLGYAVSVKNNDVVLNAKQAGMLIIIN